MKILKSNYLNFIIIFWFCLPIAASANDKSPFLIEVPDYVDKIFIPSSKVMVLKDRDSRYTIDQIVNNNAKNFIPLPKVDNIVLSEESYSYWVKIQLEGEALSKDRWFFEIPDSHVGEIIAYMQVGNDPPVLMEKAGYDHIYTTRTFRHKNIIFPIDQLNIGDNKEVKVYLKYTSLFLNVLFYKISKSETFLEYSNTEYLMLGLNYGILVCLIITSLLLYITIRDKSLIFLIAFLIGSICVGLTEDNLGAEYLFTNKPFLNYILMKYAAPVSMLTIVFLAVQFLEIRKEAFKLYLVIVGIALLNAFYFLIFKSMNDVIWRMPTFLLPFLLIFGFILTKLKREGVKVTYFFLGYIVILGGLITQVLRSYGIFISDNILVVYAYNMGLLITGLFMTLSQTEKFKILKEEKEEAQQELIKDLQIRERVIEEKVVERTEKIKAQNEIIELKNKELEWVNNELNKQRVQIQDLNSQLQIENEQLHVDVEHLESARVLMQEVTLEEFENMFPTDESCYDYLEEIKWKNGYNCKKCGNELYAKGTGPNSRRCKKCNYNESVTSGTLFHRLHFPIKKAFYMVFIVYSKKGDISSTKIAELLEMRQNTCWKFSKKIKEAMDVKIHEFGSEEELKKKGWEALILA
ncbi:7TM diverse intracellular signaling domain-containing protein [Flammeovirga agarivorans]|uniref:7TMR-DISM extracellular 2 n=1 Tax=Flammeovirga agarivorans TaxID=2726742 RepID=A0A7X8SHN2_9BACT|nr:7TM diverse intracellular signaling domain-containing protein [Flammeovirga agarivorans]NLR90327.1 hypothetical protein [Flammeovirga agarivorans]